MERIKQGEGLMLELFGEAFYTKLNSQIGEAHMPFLDFLKGTFADIYRDQTLDLKTKEIIVLTTLITQKDSKPQLKTHLKAAIKVGVTPKEIYALILHLVIYIGFPGTINALLTAKETFDEIGIAG